MADNNDNKGANLFGLLLAGVVFLAAGMFILSGGQLGGKKQVVSDSDMPPVTTGGPTK
ncbi:MAG: hypothetical protein WDO17_13825 [Alphaproteobacteria bacterium]